MFLKFLLAYPNLIADIKRQIEPVILCFKPLVDDPELMSKSVAEVVQNYKKKLIKIERTLENLQKSENEEVIQKFEQILDKNRNLESLFSMIDSF